MDDQRQAHSRERARTAGGRVATRATSGATGSGARGSSQPHRLGDRRRSRRSTRSAAVAARKEVAERGAAACPRPKRRQDAACAEGREHHMDDGRQPSVDHSATSSFDIEAEIEAVRAERAERRHLEALEALGSPSPRARSGTPVGELMRVAGEQRRQHHTDEAGHDAAQPQAEGPGEHRGEGPRLQAGGAGEHQCGDRQARRPGEQQHEDPQRDEPRADGTRERHRGEPPLRAEEQGGHRGEGPQLRANGAGEQRWGPTASRSTRRATRRRSTT